MKKKTSLIKIIVLGILIILATGCPDPAGVPTDPIKTVELFGDITTSDTGHILSVFIMEELMSSTSAISVSYHTSSVVTTETDAMLFMGIHVIYGFSSLPAGEVVTVKITHEDGTSTIETITIPSPVTNISPDGTSHNAAETIAMTWTAPVSDYDDITVEIDEYYTQTAEFYSVPADTDTSHTIPANTLSTGLTSAEINVTSEKINRLSETSSNPSYYSMFSMFIAGNTVTTSIITEE